jgi:hypothetical protein
MDFYFHLHVERIWKTVLGIQLPSRPGPPEDINIIHLWKNIVFMLNSRVMDQLKKISCSCIYHKCWNVALVRKLFQAQHVGTRREYIRWTPHRYFWTRTTWGPSVS